MQILPGFSIVSRLGSFNRLFRRAIRGVREKTEIEVGILPEFVPKGANRFGGATMRMDHLLNSDHSTLLPGTIQHSQESLTQRTVDVHYGDRPTGREHLLHQPTRMVRIAERGIEYHVCPALRLREPEGRGLPHCIAAGRENHASFPPWNEFRERPPEQLVSHPPRRTATRYFARSQLYSSNSVAASSAFRTLRNRFVYSPRWRSEFATSSSSTATRTRCASGSANGG